MAVLVLEGPDGGGKTSLAKALLKGTGLSTILISRSGPPSSSEDLQQQIEWLEFSCSLPHVNFILDRHPIISENIYGPVLRGSSWIHSWEESLKVFRNLDRKNFLILYCRPSLDILMQSSRREQQLEGVESNLLKLVEEYDQYMYRLADEGIRVRRYEFNHDFDKIVGKVRRFFTEGDFDGPPLAALQETKISNGSVPPDPEIERPMDIEPDSRRADHT